MKKTLLIISCFAAMSFTMAQDTIVGWSFPNSQLTPNYGLAINASRFIGTEDDVARPTTYTTGQVTGDSAATTTGWDNGVGTKYWTLKFKTDGYKDIKISSKQRAGNQNGGGPKDFLIQWRKGSAATWENISNDTIHCANDWATGVVSEVQLPSGADTATSNISVRWVLSSNLNTSGTTIDPLAISKIDDIIVTGTAANVGIEEILYSSNSINIYPNPSNGIIKIVSDKSISNIEIINQIGSVVYAKNDNLTELNIDLSAYGSGIYFIRLKDLEGLQYNKKIIVQ